ncbi:MAG: hypothetical protein ACI8X3_001792 [Saprospiraceae bacterium]|jgi:hypothetical protein
MLEQELKDIWKNSSRTAHITIETAQLVKELNGKMSSIQKVIRIRDIREISASVIGILIFMYFLYEIPFPITKLACAMSIIWFAYVILKLRKAKPQGITNRLDLSVKGQLAHQAEAMQHQADLLNSAAYWYAIPPFIINCVFLFGLGNSADYNWSNSLTESVLPLTVHLKIVTIIGLAFFYAFIIWINKQAAKNQIQPLIKEIELVQHQLEKTN